MLGIWQGVLLLLDAGDIQISSVGGRERERRGSESRRGRGEGRDGQAGDRELRERGPFSRWTILILLL